MKNHAPEVISATTVIGNTVKNKAGKELGKIEEIMLDRHTGEAAYAVVSFGGFLGFGDKFFAVPWTEITVDTLNKCCLMDATKETLDAAPGFDKGNWPSHADRAFMDSVYAHYNVSPYYTNPS